MHKSPDVLAGMLETAARQVKVGGTYYHYKHPDKFYTVLRLAFTEADDEVCVIYQAQYGPKFMFVRPLHSWLEIVEKDGQKLPRFTLVD